jgi:hypothetical protein
MLQLRRTFDRMSMIERMDWGRIVILSGTRGFVCPFESAI